MRPWQWVLAIPVVVGILGAIAIFAYMTLINPKAGAGVHTVTVPVVERVESRRADGVLDTSASYLVVRVEATQLRLAPRLPDWNEVAKGDLVAVEVGGTGTAVTAYSWKRAVPVPSPPPSPPSSTPK